MYVTGRPAIVPRLMEAVHMEPSVQMLELVERSVK